MEILNLKNVSFSYPEKDDYVLQSINLTVQQGEFIVVCGESGSGKTTLLKLLKREITPYGNQSGTISYQQQNIQALDERTAAKEIGFVMQNPEKQIMTDKVWHELAFGLENIGTPTATIRQQIGELANYFGIHTWFHKKTNDLSGGQKQLLNLASVMVMEPNVLLLDEPTSQLDPIATDHFIKTLQSLNEDFGLTIILVEHELEHVLSLADKMVLLEKGTITYHDHPKHFSKFLQSTKHPMYTALPTTVKVFHTLDEDSDSPLTIREGREQLYKYYFQENVLAKDEEKALPNTEKVIELKNLSFRYNRKSKDILSSLHLTVYDGEIVSLVGGNGIGKTTLLNVISGNYRPYRGKVLLRNKDIQTYKRKDLFKNEIATLPQNPATLFLKNTVREDYKEVMKLLRYSDEQYKKLMNDIQTELRIEPLLDQHPYDLSGGELQRVALGKILLVQPSIILLDEPTKGLDAFAKKRLLTTLQKLKKRGLTIVLVTHDVEFSAYVSDRVGLLFDKDIISIHSPRTFYSENKYYTTAASRLARHIVDGAVTAEDIIYAYKKSEKRILKEEN